MVKKILFCLGLVAFVFAQETQGEEEIASTEKQKNSEYWKSVFQPSEVEGNVYGTFRIGYAYQYQNGSKITNTQTSHTFDSKQQLNSVYFGIERGWIGLKNKMLMVGGYLDGAAGQTFFLSVGARVSARLLNGWLIPHASFGYQIQHLSFPADTAQYNIHGGVGTVGLFVNVAKGFGVDFSLRAGTPFYLVKAADAKKFNHPVINHVGFMISFTFYDFSI